MSVTLLTGAGLTAGLFTWIGAAATSAGLSFATLLAAGVNVIRPACSCSASARSSTASPHASR